MRGGAPATEAVATVTTADTGRNWRQLMALDMQGRSGTFTGRENEPVKGALAFDGGIVSGNILANEGVLQAMADGFRKSDGEFPRRILSALSHAEDTGGDRRGLMSAALLVLSNTAPPLTLRVDFDETPLKRLDTLLRKATSGDYAGWTRQVPCPKDRFRHLP